MTDLWPRLEALLGDAERPARYINREWGCVYKPEADFRFCMVYPDTYELGQANQAVRILVNAVNAADGMAAAELAGLLTKKRDDICLLGLLDTLEYLRRGGRISRTAALAGGLLGIKPVVTLENGAVTMIGKARGSKQGNNLLVQKVRESGGIDFSLPILLGYTGLSDALLQKYVADSAALWRDHCGSLEQTLLCSVIGTHTGPGVVAVAFFKNGV